MAGRAKNFKCPSCNESFHIKRYNSHWVRYMPPRFCPMCGERITNQVDKNERLPD